MKLSLSLIFALLTVGRLFAADVVVNFKTAPSNPAAPVQSSKQSELTNVALLRALATDLENHNVLEETIPLVDFPVFGKTVSGAHGTVQFHRQFKGGLVAHVTLESLPPQHYYILTLNGNPSRAGNANLVSSVPGNEKERYYDFQIIRSNDAGSYEASIALALPASDYEVRFYVKDTTDYKIILYHDFFLFKVE